MRDAIHQRARLAGSRAGNDQERSVSVRCGSKLFGIELRTEVASGGRDFTFTTRIDAELVRHSDR